MTAAAEGEDDVAGFRQLVGPRGRGDRTGVDFEHDEVAVLVRAGDGTLLGASVRERHQRRAVAKVVGIGQDLAGSDHHAAAAAVAADGDDGAAQLGEHGTSGGGEFVERRHGGSLLFGVTC